MYHVIHKVIMILFLFQFIASGSRVRLYLPKDSCLISFLLAGNIQLHTILYACTKLYCRPNCSLFSIRAGADPGFLDGGLD